MSAGGSARATLAALGLLLASTGLGAQTVVTSGTSDVALDRRLERLLDAEPWIITSDTRIPLEDTVPRSILILDATVILEGTVLGDVVAVDAGVFVRHAARVNGDLVNVGGGLFRSARAGIGGTIIDLPDARYRVIREPERIVIEASQAPVRLTLDGFLGLRQPTYDRVNGLTVAWGGRYRLPRVREATPALGGYVGWRTELGEPVYAAFAEVRLGAITATAGYERGWETRDDWAWGDMRNSFNYLWDGEDFLDYYESRRRWVAVRRAFGDETKRFSGALWLEGQVEDGESLLGGDPWHIFGDAARPNPAVDDGRVTSGSARLELEWHGFETDLEVAAEYEAAREGWLDSDHAFDRVTGRGRFALHGFLDHTLEIHAFGQLPVGGDTLPRQRWTFAGGFGRLHTVPLGARRGDHVLLLSTRYRIPTPEALALPLLGPPELQLMHIVGDGWLADDGRALVQEVGGRIRFFGLYVQYLFRPDATAERELAVGLTWPFEPGYPWER